MDDTLLHVDHGEPLATLADALAVQYPQRLFGVVERVVDGAVAALPDVNHIAMPVYGSRGYRLDDDKAFEARYEESSVRSGTGA